MAVVVEVIVFAYEIQWPVELECEDWRMNSLSLLREVDDEVIGWNNVNCFPSRMVIVD